jgi:hypothetical protein
MEIKHMTEKTFMIRKTNSGWTCRVRNSRATGWGSRPDLAIRDWKVQSKAFDKLEVK